MRSPLDPNAAKRCGLLRETERDRERQRETERGRGEAERGRERQRETKRDKERIVELIAAGQFAGGALGLEGDEDHVEVALVAHHRVRAGGSQGRRELQAAADTELVTVRCATRRN